MKEETVIKKYSEESKLSLSERHRQYYIKNQEVIKEKKKKYYEANKDKIKEKNKIKRKGIQLKPTELLNEKNEKINNRKEILSLIKNSLPKIESKRCTKCGEVKLIENFGIKYGNNSGIYNPWCKKCINEWDKIYREKNKEKRKAKNKETKENNRELFKQRRMVYNRNRIKHDIFFKLKLNIRCLINNSFMGKDLKKKEKTEEILGCTFGYFKSYIESKFEPWMTWENKGLYNGTPNFGWDIDHIIPLITATSKEDLVKLNHYSNLQPLCSYLNRDVKKDKY